MGVGRASADGEAGTWPPPAFLHFAKAVNTALFFPSRPHRSPQLQSNRVHGPAEASKEKETANRSHGGWRVGPCQSYLNIQDEITAESSPDLARESSSPATVYHSLPGSCRTRAVCLQPSLGPAGASAQAGRTHFSSPGPQGCGGRERIELGNHSCPLRAPAFTSSAKLRKCHLSEVAQSSICKMG